MILKYERACAEAGLAEEKTVEIRRVFQEGQNIIRRETYAREVKGIIPVFISGAADGEDMADLDIPDTAPTAETAFTNNEDMKVLLRVLEMISEDDRKFILRYYGEAGGNLSGIARLEGIPRTTAAYRRDRILKEIRKIYFEINPGDFTGIFQ